MPTDTSFGFFNEELARLTASFHKRVAHHKSEGYDESALRNDYLNPLWRALGWDTENREGATQPLREVQIENRIDQLVYGLYGLSEKDVALVENS